MPNVTFTMPRYFVDTHASHKKLMKLDCDLPEPTSEQIR